MIEGEAALLQQPLFAGLAPELAVSLTDGVRALHFEAGTRLFQEGGAADEFFLIRAGVVGLETRIPGRGAVLFATLGAGEMLGVSWLVPPYRWCFDARALATARCFGVDARRLRALCDQDHDLGYELLRRLSAQLVRRLHDTRLQMLDVYRSPRR